LFDLERAARVTARITLAVVLGGVLGFEREFQGKAAGVRTHMLVALGAALFVMVLQFDCPRGDCASSEALSRVIQGIAAGIGLLCAGTILKSDELGRIKGLTTAAGIWMTTAIGVAVGIGSELIAMIATAMGLVILNVLHRLMERVDVAHVRTQVRKH
jgi:putative Mg2+ transporter-C (MgtC) family protein